MCVLCCGTQYIIWVSFKLESEYKMRTSSKEFFISFVHVFALSNGVTVGRQHGC